MASPLTDNLTSPRLVTSPASPVSTRMPRAGPEKAAGSFWYPTAAQQLRQRHLHQRGDGGGFGRPLPVENLAGRAVHQGGPFRNSVARAQEHPAYGALYRAIADAVQGFLAEVSATPTQKVARQLKGNGGIPLW